MEAASIPGGVSAAHGEDEPGLAEVKAAADGAELDGAEEKSALDFLLGSPTPRRYYVDVDFDTPEGVKKLRWTLKAIDARKIDEIEERNRNESTGTLDVTTANCQLVAEASVSLSDPDGANEVGVSDPEFLTMRLRRTGEEGLHEHRFASPADAIEARFRTQLGLVAGVASRIREKAGWDPERVGKAQRVLVEASGN